MKVFGKVSEECHDKKVGKRENMHGKRATKEREKKEEEAEEIKLRMNGNKIMREKERKKTNLSIMTNN